ncbi:hypothetical protein ACXO7D_05340 [Lactobacillus delbrueckii subsp. bulgaricus]|nr:hypothetical protein [Lactobacillus delbrueckii subsp. bulgaricus]MBT9001237.1 hypothetical protein [Lactobacillus delbrueckii subsp. bulgaricus]
MPLSESKKRANQKWNEAHKERMRYLQYRSKARKFISDLADNSDLNDLAKFIKERQEKMGNDGSRH